MYRNLIFEGEWREFPARDEPGARHNHSPNSDSSSGRQQTIYLYKKNILIYSVTDPCNFGTDPGADLDPRIHNSD
jgi:hypothetical protein